MMDIQVDANFKLTRIFDPPLRRISLNEEEITLWELLKRLDSLWQTVHILEGNDLSDDIKELYLNGQSYFTLPGYLNALLKGQDRVWIERDMAPLGGGQP